MKITYIGHATLLLEIGGATILTDPNFDAALGAFALGSRLKRVSAPGVALSALPRLDAVLVTHAHVDHLSLASLRAIPRDVPVWAPPGVARWLGAKGFGQAMPLPPGATTALGGAGGLAVHAESATHVGSRYGVDRWRAEASMYLLEAPEASVFFAGDTGLTATTHAIAERVLHAAGRRLDVALLPIGHAPRWKRRAFRAGHLTYDDALELFQRLGARYFVPYHWGTFNHLTSGAHEAIELLRAHLPTYPRANDVRILEPGESLHVDTSATRGEPA